MSKNDVPAAAYLELSLLFFNMAAVLNDQSGIVVVTVKLLQSQWSSMLKMLIYLLTVLIPAAY